MVVSLAHVRGRGTSRHYARGVTAARAWHLLTAVVALAALGLQLVLVVNGDAILVDHDPPNLAERLLRFLAYFTIDAGPHVKVLCAAPDAPRVEAALAATPAVMRVLCLAPGPGAQVIHEQPL